MRTAPGDAIWLAPLGTFVTICTTGTRLTPPGFPPSRFPSIGPGNLIAFERGKAPAKLVVLLGDGRINLITDGSSDDRNPSWGTLPKPNP